MLIPLGILASAGGVPPATSDYELISTALITGNTANVTFDVSAFTSTYKHLQIRATIRSSYVNPADFMKITFNNDTTGYSRHGLGSNGSSTTSFGLTDIIGANDTTAATAGSGQYGTFIMDILDPYSTTKNTTVRILGGHVGSFNVIQLTSGLWIDTSAVSSIKIESGNSPSSIVAGSRFSIYGLKG
jgi:hypothetical protein